MRERAGEGRGARQQRCYELPQLRLAWASFGPLARIPSLPPDLPTPPPDLPPVPCPPITRPPCPSLPHTCRQQFDQATLYDAYEKRTAALKPDRAAYEAARATDPEFYRAADSLQYGGAGASKVSEEGVDRMVAELNERCGGWGWVVRWAVWGLGGGCVGAVWVGVCGDGLRSWGCGWFVVWGVGRGALLRPFLTHSTTLACRPRPCPPVPPASAPWSRKNKTYSRRRAFRADKDVDAINDRNAHFNKKIERAFGTHTAEIKANLERGTALPS